MSETALAATTQSPGLNAGPGHGPEPAPCRGGSARLGAKAQARRSVDMRSARPSAQTGCRGCRLCRDCRPRECFNAQTPCARQVRQLLRSDVRAGRGGRRGGGWWWTGGCASRAPRCAETCLYTHVFTRISLPACLYPHVFTRMSLPACLYTHVFTRTSLHACLYTGRLCR